MTRCPPSSVRDVDPAVYDELRRMAQRLMKAERSGHTLQATALVHEAWLRLARGSAPSGSPRPGGREHFLSLAAIMMRRILVDHARARATLRRGQARLRLSTEDMPELAQDRRDLDLLILDEALERLAALDARQARIVEYRFFGGMALDEIAAVMGLGERTVDREWACAKAWLFRAMAGAPGDPAAP